MSKAFTKESDNGSDRPSRQPASASLAPGVINHITASGARVLEGELKQATEVDRPNLAASRHPDDKERLLLLEERIAFIRAILASAVVPPPETADPSKVRFGATVTVRDSKGALAEYKIVGVDEVDLDKNWVSWISPIARALLNQPVGAIIPFKFPAGQDRLEILSIRYDD